MPMRWHSAEWHRKQELMPHLLSEEQARVLQSHCDECLRYYLKLASMAVESGELLFPIRPKLHATQLVRATHGSFYLVSKGNICLC